MPIVVLNDALQPTTNNKIPVTSDRLIHDMTKGITDVYPTFNYKTQEMVVRQFEQPDYYSTNLVGALSLAYSNHHKITINPTDIWFMIHCELIAIVDANAEALRHLFTTSNEKQVVTVKTSNVESISLNAVYDVLLTKIPTDTALFLPSFSTDTPAAKYARLAALCSMVKTYYSYMTFCCGIPAIKIGGTREDWELIRDNMRKIVILFSAVDISEWGERVEKVISGILTAFDETPDVDFFKNIFRQQNVGSGRQLDISGWITDLFFKKEPVVRINNCPKCVAIVPYTNVDTGRVFAGLYGGFGTTTDDDGFNTIVYSEAIVEIVNN